MKPIAIRGGPLFVFEVERKSPVVRLNRAIAIAIAGDPARGLTLLDEVDGLTDYRYFHVARADLLRRVGNTEAAAAAYERALALTGPGPEQRHLERRLRALRQHTPE